MTVFFFMHNQAFRAFSYWLTEELLAPFTYTFTFAARVKAALCRPVYLKGRFNIPSFPKSRHRELYIALEFRTGFLVGGGLLI